MIVPFLSQLNEKFRSLDGEIPDRNDIMLDLDENAAVIFDGRFWREFDLDGLANG